MTAPIVVHWDAWAPDTAPCACGRDCDPQVSVKAGVTSLQAAISLVEQAVFEDPRATSGTIACGLVIFRYFLAPDGMYAWTQIRASDLSEIASGLYFSY